VREGRRREAEGRRMELENGARKNGGKIQTEKIGEKVKNLGKTSSGEMLF
jgi:hypothetical protein